jgi:hypothetical protein
MEFSFWVQFLSCYSWDSLFGSFLCADGFIILISICELWIWNPTLNDIFDPKVFNSKMCISMFEAWDLLHLHMDYMIQCLWVSFTAYSKVKNPDVWWRVEKITAGYISLHPLAFVVTICLSDPPLAVSSARFNCILRCIFLELSFWWVEQCLSLRFSVASTWEVLLSRAFGIGMLAYENT